MTTKSGRINQYGMCLDEYEENEVNRNVYFKRAIGEYPEMECSKALGDMLSEYVKDNESILDVGCAVGHYYRSFKKRIIVKFTYTGVDQYKILIDKALEAWEGEKNVSFKIGNIFEKPLKEIIDRGFSVKYFREHSDLCLAGEDTSFISNFMTKSGQSIFKPAIPEEIFSKSDIIKGDYINKLSVKD